MNARQSLLFSHRRTPVVWLAALLLAGGAAASVGLSSAYASVHANSTKRVVIATFTSHKLGTILSDGRTLYTLRPSSTACTSLCHKYWIPVMLPKGEKKAIAGPGVSAAKLGTKGVAGGLQVTFANKALFWFFGDSAVGQVTGNVIDTWGKWSDIVLVKPTTGSTTTTQPAKSTTTTTAPVTPTTQPPTPTTSPGGGGGVGF